MDAQDRNNKMASTAPNKASTPIDELKTDKHRDDRRLFETMVKHADLVDDVLMENGDPDQDLSSG
jgi:hypothetical protein